MGFLFLLTSLIILSPSLIINFESYGSYADMKSTYNAVVNQYRESIRMYEDRVVLDINTESFTDFKYEGYQESISSLIKDLRRKVTRYNQLYIGKEVWSRNIFLSWLIKKPDEDMKLLRLEE